MTNTVKLLTERRSAKRFVDYDLKDSEINSLIEAARMAPSSFGVEPFNVIFITNKELREELTPAWWGQPGVAHSSGIMIWTSYNEKAMEEFVIDKLNKQNIPDEFSNIRDDMKGGLHNVWATNKITDVAWSQKQAYISMSAAVIDAAELGIDVCPSEGFDAAAVGKILEAKGLMDTKYETVAIGMFVGKVDEKAEFHHFFNKTRRDTKDMSKIVK